MKRSISMPAAVALLILASTDPAISQQPRGSQLNTQAAPTLSERLAAGATYVLITRRDLFPRQSEGRDIWFAIHGYYVPAKGTWTSSATGFPTPGTPWHSCPKETWCGGVHERGMVLDRWYRPEQHEIVVIGQKLTFDEAGRVFHNEQQIGMIMTPSFGSRG